jgi:hypothetical protein
VDTNIETIEPSGSNDALFFRTMTGVEQQLQHRARMYRRRMVTGMVMTTCAALVLLVGLAFMFGSHV